MNKTLAIILVIVVAILALPLVASLVKRGTSNGEPEPGTWQAEAPKALSSEAKAAYEMVEMDLQFTKVRCAALGAAIWQGDREKVQAFLDAGADINAPLNVAFPNMPEFSSCAANMGVEAVAMGAADAAFVAFLLEKGASANVSIQRCYAGPDGVPGPLSTETPLTNAFSADRIDLMELLLEHGADPNTPLSAGERRVSLLKLAKGRRNDAAVEVLIRYGARE